ncbi:GNAT family N-acetyltransferase [Nocardioides pantholopis]|uniref:GNAT family N-acetyltransferase n=1 Tax=Nocardioides pantholopis TaxID=2483798 RepID=UPI000FD9F78C|nr:GNAT family protein [Nocardioides pantholopis]
MSTSTNTGASTGAAGSRNEHGQPVGPELSDWHGAEPPAPVELTGRYVRLEPVAAGHAEPLHAALGDPADAELWTYRPDRQPADVAGMARDVVAPLAGATGQVGFAIVPDGRAAEGLVTYSRVEPEHGVIEISGVLLARTLQRTAAATEALHLMLRHAVEDLGYRRVEWKCDALNEPSRRAAQRLGFTHEGIFGQHLVIKGRARDTAWFSLLDHEWPEVRAAHERWLDPANFDADGRQREPLRAPAGRRGAAG